MQHSKTPFFLCVLYIFFIGCQSTKMYSYIANDTYGFRGKKITKVTLKDGDIREFNEDGGTFYQDRIDSNTVVQKIIGIDANNQPFNVNLDRVLEVQCLVTKSDSGATTFLAILGGLILVSYVLAALVVSSLGGSHL